mmetsp:Transcript_54582/g.108327  ORF Transcript_54582/g.108327 Transcript_54582/m.108327 type:complete len:217 (+) Transcript_54582:204-854(+)
MVNLAVHLSVLFLHIQVAYGIIVPSKSTGVHLRLARPSDINHVSELLVEAFEPRFRWFEFPERSRRKIKYRDAIGSRISSTNDTPHQCWVAEVTGTREVVAFAESGFLPPPFSLPIPAVRPDNDAGVAAVELDDVPYIANLCVAPTFQRRGIAGKLVMLSCEWAAQRTFTKLFVSVDRENFAARALYERLDFLAVLPPEGALERRRLFYCRHTEKI